MLLRHVERLGWASTGPAYVDKVRGDQDGRAFCQWLFHRLAIGNECLGGIFSSLMGKDFCGGFNHVATFHA